MKSAAPVAPTPPEWAWIHLQDAALGVFDCPHSTPILAREGPYLARTQDIGGGVFRRESAARVSRSTYEERVARARPTTGDLLYSREGTYFGAAAEVPPDAEVCLGQRMVLIRPDPTILDFRYARYWLNSDPMRTYVHAHKDGSVAQRLNLPIIRSIPIPVPPLEEQRGIAATLGALDDKIESNRRAIDLEVEFAIARLSSGESSVRVGDEATLAKGLSYRGSGLADSADGDALPMLNLGNFTTRGQLKYGGLKFYRGEFKQSHRLAGGELLIANTDLTQARDLLGRGFLVPPALAGAIHTHHTSVIRFAQRPWLAVCLWAQLQSSEFRERAMGFATGTTVTALPPAAVLDFGLRFPTDGEDAVNRVMSVLRHAWYLKTESDRLELIRDTLLPELLSGRIRVPEAREAVTDAVFF